MAMIGGDGIGEKFGLLLLSLFIFNGHVDAIDGLRTVGPVLYSACG